MKSTYISLSASPDKYTHVSPTLARLPDLPPRHAAPHLRAVIAPPFSGKSFACRQYGWFDIDQLSIMQPALETANIPTWLDTLYHVGQALPIDTIVAVPAPDVAMSMGIATQQSVCVIVGALGHELMALRRGCPPELIPDVLGWRASLHIWALEFEVPVMTSFAQAERHLAALLTDPPGAR